MINFDKVQKWFGSFDSSLLAYLFALPQLAVISIFFIYPTALSLRSSLFRSVPFRGLVEFIGIRNFIDLLTSSSYHQSLMVSAIFALSVTIIGVGVSLVLATLTDRIAKFAGFYRAALIWPYAISPTIAGVVWGFLFHPTYGVVSYYSPIRIDWLSNGWQALFLLVVAATWRQLGYNIAFYVAGLQSIPQSLEEAAVVDGANGWQRFWRITFPMLTPITFFLLTMNFIYASFRTFGMVHALTGGGPAGFTNILIYKVYTNGFIDLKLGYSAAQSVMLLVFVAGISWFQFRYTERRVAYR